MPTKLNDTKNLPGILKVCVGARVLLTVNLNVSDGLSNGALGSVVGIRGTQDRILNGIIYVKFDNDVVGASCKVHQGHLKGSVPIQARVDTFELKRKRSDIKVSRKQFPLILAHAITIHKSQSATYKYMVLNFDRSTKNPSKKNSTTQGLAYTGLSRGEERSGIVVKKFDPQIIQANKKALHEMERMRNGRLLRDIWSHPLEKMTDCKLSLLNIVSWNLHIKDFLSDSIHCRALDMFCFTETHVNNNPVVDIGELTDNSWSNKFEPTEHGLAFCYKNETVKFIKTFKNIRRIEIMSNLIEYKENKVIVVIVYRPEKHSIRDFMNDLREEIEALPSEYRKVIVGDFNFDLRSENNELYLTNFLHRLNMEQKVNYTTHVKGGILDLVIDVCGSTGTTDWMPTPFSDHFIIYYSFY